MNEPHQMDVFEVLDLVEKEGLVPEAGDRELRDPIDIITDCGETVRIAGAGDPPLLEPVVVRVGFEFVVLVNGERVNERKLWSQIEAWAFIDGLRARV